VAPVSDRRRLDSHSRPEADSLFPFSSKKSWKNSHSETCLSVVLLDEKMVRPE
jgi:hypothetical protein